VNDKQSPQSNVAKWLHTYRLSFLLERIIMFVPLYLGLFFSQHLGENSI
jgi:hypothetical protein